MSTDDLSVVLGLIGLTVDDLDPATAAVVRAHVAGSDGHDTMNEILRGPGRTTGPAEPDPTTEAELATSPMGDNTPTTEPPPVTTAVPTGARGGVSAKPSMNQIIRGATGRFPERFE